MTTEPGTADPVERFLAAIRDDERDLATAILRDHPSVAGTNIFAAAAAADADAVAAFLNNDRASALATLGRDAAPPLVYACASPFGRHGDPRARDVLRIATLLLDAGASPDSFNLFDDGSATQARIPVLYHACMCDNRELVALLLDRGAATQDGESIYHAAQHDRRECLELLLAHGADVSAAQSPWGNTPLYFLIGHFDDGNGAAAWFKGMTWLLTHGADPNVPSTERAETPLHGLAAGRAKPATARALLAHGANVDAIRADGRTPYVIAVRRGNTTIAAVLAEHGAETGTLAPIDEFLGACHAADRRRAQKVLANHPGLLDTLSDDDRGAPQDAVNQRNSGAIRLLAEFGFRLDWLGPGGGTPLHVAAWHGEVELVTLLLQLGAPVNVRDRQYGSSPLGWTAHGSGCNTGHDAAYCAIAGALLDAGSERDATINRRGEPAEALASPGVARYLKDRGFVPEGPTGASR